MNALVLPRMQLGEDVRDYLNSVVRELEQWANTGAAGRQHYVVTNPAAQRTLDAAGGTLADVLKVTGTMIVDLQQKGSLP